ncbi:MAG: acyl-ACP desaturase [Anaerolineae bacterium]|nr:acyl-ACP desaturase [Anaerolineae bacterium]
MSFGQVDQRLENKLKELYRQHKERSAKIDWSYHQYLPLPSNRDDLFAQEIVDKPNPRRSQLSPEIYLAVETALLTEVNLPWFTTELYNTFRGSLQVLVDFVRTWTAEEDQHGELLDFYLVLTNNGDALERRRLRKFVIEQGFETGLQTPLETMVYTSIQERATMVFYLNVAQACEEEDPGLATILRRLAKDETLHYTFYRDATRAHLEINPNLVELVTGVMQKFEMPGAGMPDYQRRMQVIAKHAHYGPAEFYSQVIDELMKHWDIANLQPTYPSAREAQLRALQHHARLGRIAERELKRRGKLIPIEEALDRVAFEDRANGMPTTPAPI